MQITGQCIRILVVFVAVLLAGTSNRPALAAQYSAIVMDMRDGTVLYESNPDRRQAPASLTKMMTLYLAFEAVENGQLRLNQRVRVSRSAARQPPSKLYLKSGQRVSIRSLIRASAVKSANDAAVALAEAVAGSEKAFARLMTAKARQLGMTNTTFRNASGLTARGHLSTARDMAILGRHLFFDFPQYYNLFSRRTARAAGKRVYNTNRRLLSSYPGADGIKTGYTRAAGYNLVGSAHRGGKRIIAALFGGKSSRWRSARMANLLDKGFARARTRVAMVPPRFRRVVVASAPLPPAKPGTPATGLAALAQALGSQAVAATPPSTSPLAPLYAVVPPARSGQGADIRHLLIVRSTDRQRVLERTEVVGQRLAQAVREGIIDHAQTVTTLLPSAATQRARRDRLHSTTDWKARLARATADTPFRADAFTPFGEAVARTASDTALVTADDYRGSSLEALVAGGLYFDGEQWVSVVTLSGLRDVAALRDSAFADAPDVGLVDLKDASLSLVERYRMRVLFVLAISFVTIGVLLVWRIGLTDRSLWILGTLSTAILLTTGLTAQLLGTLSLFNLVATVLVAGLGLDYCLFLSRRGSDAADARDTRHAVHACVASTLAAFTVLALSAVPVLHSIGLTVAVGVSVNFLLARLGLRVLRAISTD